MKRNTIAFIMMLALVSNQGGIYANATEIDKSEDYSLSEVLETAGDNEDSINVDYTNFDITGQETRKLKEIKIEPGKKFKITNNSDNKGMVKTKDAEFSGLVNGEIVPIKTRTDGLLSGKSTVIVGNDSEEEITVYMLEDFANNCTIEGYSDALEEIDFDITGQETRKLKEIKIEPGNKFKITNNSDNKGLIKTKSAEFSTIVDGQTLYMNTRTDGLLSGKSTLIVRNDSEEEITVYMLEEFAKNCTIEGYSDALGEIDFDITGQETRKLKEIKIEPGNKFKITNNSDNKGLIKTKNAEFSTIVDGQTVYMNTRTDGLLSEKSTLIVGNSSEEEITVYMLEDFAKDCTIEGYSDALGEIDFDITGQETRKLKEIKIEPGKKFKITNNSENKGLIKAKDAEFSTIVDGQTLYMKTRTDGLVSGKSTLIVGNSSEEEITVYMLEDFAKNCTIAEYGTSPVIKYNVIFMVDGVQYGETQTIEQGNAAIKPEDPKKEGFTFTNWDTSFDKVTTDLVVNAQFKAVVSNEENDKKEDEGQSTSETTDNDTTTSNGNSESASSGDASKGLIAGLAFVMSGLAIGGLFKRKEN